MIINDLSTLFWMATTSALLFWGVQLFLWWMWIMYYYHVSGLSGRSIPTQLLVFSLMSYALLIGLHLFTVNNHYALDAFVPHTITTAGTLILLIAVNAFVILATLISQTLACYKTWRLAFNKLLGL